MLNTKTRTKDNKKKEIAVSKADLKITLEQFNAYFNGKRKPLNVYLYENVEKQIFFICYQMNKKQEKIEFKYTRCGREQGNQKANAKIQEIQKQYDDLGVVIINKTTTEEDKIYHNIYIVYFFLISYMYYD